MQENQKIDDKYAWQDTLYDKWARTGYYGLCKATPSAGKTKAGCKCILRYMERWGDNSEIWVIAPTHEILDQWIHEPLIKDKRNITFITYGTAVTRLIQRVTKDEFDVPDLLVLDEAHVANAPVMGKVLSMNVPHILALTATPNGIDKALPIFETIDWSHANVSPTTIHYVHFKMNDVEKAGYDKKTHSIEKYQLDHPYANMYNDQILELLYLRRRDYTYKLKTRLNLALQLVKLNQGRRMMIFFERKAQVEEFSKCLNEENIEHCIHISGKEHLDEYVDEVCDIVLCCKKLTAGFSNPSTEVAIVVSTALGKVNHIQTVGRAIRPKEGKHADIYVLLAEDTGDTQLFKQRGQMFPLEWTVKEDEGKYNQNGEII